MDNTQCDFRLSRMDEATMISDNLFKLKKMVEELRYTGDDLLFDHRLAQIDLVIYDLRTEAFVCAPRPARIKRESTSEGVNLIGLDSIIDDICASTSQGQVS